MANLQDLRDRADAKRALLAIKPVRPKPVNVTLAAIFEMDAHRYLKIRKAIREGRAI